MNWHQVKDLLLIDFISILLGVIYSIMLIILLHYTFKLLNSIGNKFKLFK